MKIIESNLKFNKKLDKSIHAKNDRNHVDIFGLQKYMNRNGFTDYENKRLVEDGILGKRTQSAFEKLCRYIKDENIKR
ncbi:hypothetical protein [Oceanirhabdus sp. W0125-5]|uniref:hypothetical protein n=1 Tax=Oceanirhabdus sp. W0125-5 TaxID=2999116 RepID=UPI0022F326E7|nr:hypothetical protein [Oceanirhabdus sp. W0125-5]WBW97577.1 hypothetical protein OW730_01875 [Oceanirhabdus sp. W0125-5]